MKRRTFLSGLLALFATRSLPRPSTPLDAADMVWEPLPADPQLAEILIWREQQREVIARIFAVPPALLGDNTLDITINASGHFSL